MYVRFLSRTESGALLSSLAKSSGRYIVEVDRLPFSRRLVASWTIAQAQKLRSRARAEYAAIAQDGHGSRGPHLRRFMGKRRWSSEKECRKEESVARSNRLSMIRIIFWISGRQLAVGSLQIAWVPTDRGSSVSRLDTEIH